jgi:hypothetical protein
VAIVGSYTYKIPEEYYWKTAVKDGFKSVLIISTVIHGRYSDPYHVTIHIEISDLHVVVKS